MVERLQVQAFIYFFFNSVAHHSEVSEYHLLTSHSTLPFLVNKTPVLLQKFNGQESFPSENMESNWATQTWAV